MEIYAVKNSSAGWAVILAPSPLYLTNHCSYVTETPLMLPFESKSFLHYAMNYIYIYVYVYVYIFSDLKLLCIWDFMCGCVCNWVEKIMGWLILVLEMLFQIWHSKPAFFHCVNSKWVLKILGNVGEIWNEFGLPMYCSVYLICKVREWGCMWKWLMQQL